MDESVDDFKGLWTSFSMNQLETTIESLAETVKALKGAFEDCNIDALVGKALVEDIMAAAVGLVTGNALRGRSLSVIVLFPLVCPSNSHWFLSIVFGTFLRYKVLHVVEVLQGWKKLRWL
jgi:hypothetical protein